MTIYVTFIILYIALLLLYLDLASLRDERRWYIRIFILSSLAVAFSSVYKLPNQQLFGQLFMQSAYLMLCAHISLYLRNIHSERRTSPYLVLLACMPAILVSLLFILDRLFPDELRSGLLIQELSAVYGEISFVLILGSLAYDCWTYFRESRRSKLDFGAVDAQLGRMMWLLKIGFVSALFLCMIFPAGLYLTARTYAGLSLAVLLFFICLPSWRFIRQRWISSVDATQVYQSLPHSSRQELPMSWMEIDQLIDRQQLFLNSAFKPGDLRKYTKLSEKQIQELISTSIPGQNWSAYLDEKRLAYSLKQFEDISRNLSAGDFRYLILQAGFHSPSHFYAVYRSKYGDNPHFFFS